MLAGVLLGECLTAFCPFLSWANTRNGITPYSFAMITDHKEITSLLREGGTLTLNLGTNRATVSFPEIAVVNVDWDRARRYVKRMRHGSYPHLAQRVVLKYPDRETTVYQEEQATDV